MARLARSRPGRPLGSTYRLQLNGLGLAGAAELVPYLASLGVETLYTSPLLEAARGSTHGYDVVDPTRIDPALGSEEDLEVLLGALESHGMRLLLDIVPNHMAATPDNRFFSDVLALGQESPYAGWFDIDWAAGGGKVVLPILGRPLGEVLAAGEIEVRSGALGYFERSLPLAPGSLERAGAGDLCELLELQHYRLTHWRAGRWVGNYRRFFDVDGLIGVRVEDAEVYEATHERVLELASDVRVAGVRVDHVDGLADPAGYCERLEADIAARRPVSDPATVVVEKILARDEAFPECLAADGSTGYELADLAVAVLAGRGVARGDAGGEPSSLSALATRAKREILGASFPGQLASLAERVVAAANEDEPGCELVPGDVGAAVAEVTVQLGVYRTYLGGGRPASPEDRRWVTGAMDRSRPGLDPEGRRALEVFGRGLLDRALVPSSRWAEVARRWQQLTGAVAAKGVEDTAMYRIDAARALALGDVGSDPSAGGIGLEDFHEAMAWRAEHLPGALNATTTHDSKRSEDVRARLVAAGEDAAWWERQLGRWHRRYGPVFAALGGPDPHDERLAYQAAFSIWPPPRAARAALTERLREYSVKAAREAKLRTSWVDPGEAYEAAIGRAWSHLLKPGSGFSADLDRALLRLGPAAASTALSLATLRLCAPGVPDTYQGNESWAPSLVDPDNRRPVDFRRLHRELGRIDQGSPSARTLLETYGDGRVKLLVVSRLLRARRERTELFASGRYEPLLVRGPGRDHVVAFSRSLGAKRVVVVAVRRPFGLAGAGRFPVGRVWGATTLSIGGGSPGARRHARELTDVVSGRRLSPRGRSLELANVLGDLPVAALVEDV